MYIMDDKQTEKYSYCIAKAHYTITPPKLQTTPSSIYEASFIQAVIDKLAM